MAYAAPTAWYISQGDGSTTGYYAVAARPQNAAVAAGVLGRQFTAPAFGSERVFACVVGGTTANTTDATWTITKGAKTTDGTVTWIEVTGQPAVNGDISAGHCPVWTVSSTPALGTIIYDSVTQALQVCTTSAAGGTGSVPSFSATAGTPTADGSATWTSLGLASGFGAWAAPHCWPHTAISWGAAGNDYYMADNGTFLTSNTITVNPTGLARVLSIDHTASVPPTSATLKAGAVIGSNSSTHQWTVGNTSQQSYWYGITCKNTGNFGGNIGGGGSTNLCVMYFESCTFGSSASGFTVGGFSQVTWDSCTLGSSFTLASGVLLKWRGGSCGAVGSFSTASTAMFSVLEIDDVDLSAQTAATISAAGSLYVGSRTTLRNCKLTTSGVMTASRPLGHQVDVVTSNNGSINYNNERHGANGDMTTQTLYRSGGASDGATAVSWQVVSIGTNWQWPFEAFQIAQWNAVTGADRTVTLYGCTLSQASIPNNDDVWIDVEYQGSASSPLGSVATSTKSSTLTANAPCTADSSSSWVAPARQNSHVYSVGDIMQPTGDTHRIYICTNNGSNPHQSAGSEPGGYASASDGGTVSDGNVTFQACFRFKMAATLSAPQPQNVGYIYVTPKVAKASTTFLLDPLIVLS